MFLGSDKIIDDMTDTLMNNLAQSLGSCTANIPSASVKEDLAVTDSENVSIEGDGHDIASFTTFPTQGQFETNDSAKYHKNNCRKCLGPLSSIVNYVTDQTATDHLRVLHETTKLG